MKPTQYDRFAAAGLAFGALLLNLGLLSKDFVFEGLIRAMPIETGRWGYLFPGNYLLYGPLGLTFHTFLHAIGLKTLAVVSLQGLDTCLGAIGIGIFYLLLRRLGLQRFLAGAGSALLAFSLGYWLWSTDAENYILSTLLLIGLFYSLIRYAEDRDPDPITIGTLFGLAIMGHIINTLFGVVIAWFFYRVHGREAWRPMARCVVAAFLVAGTAYLAVLFTIQKPTSAHQALTWFMGSANTESGFRLGGGFTIPKIRDWLKTTVHIFISFRPGYTQPAPWPVALYLLIAAGGFLFAWSVLGATRIRAIYRANPAVVGGCLIWLGTYALWFTRWEPWTMVYRVSDLVPLWMLLLLALQRIAERHRVAIILAPVVAVCLFIGNLGAELYPRSQATNNPHLARMDFLREQTGTDAWITGDSRVDEIYIPYFAQRRPIVIERFAHSQGMLTEWIDKRLAAGEDIYVTSRVLERPIWKDYFSRYRLQQQAAFRNEFYLYRLVKK
jgi:hypothetical protein